MLKSISTIAQENDTEKLILNRTLPALNIMRWKLTVNTNVYIESDIRRVQSRAIPIFTRKVKLPSIEARIIMPFLLIPLQYMLFYSSF